MMCPVPNERRIAALSLLQINNPAEMRLVHVQELANKDPGNRQRYFDAYIYLRDEPDLLEIPTPGELAEAEEILRRQESIRHELLVEKALLLNPPRSPEARGPLA